MAKRLSLILGDEDQRRIGPFIEAGTGEHEVLQRWAAAHGFRSIDSEAAAIRAVLQAGVEALRDDVLDGAYAELAHTFNAPEQRAERRAARKRYADRADRAQ